MIRVEQQPGWVLHRRPWRESSLLIELFSRDYGRIGLVARGARGARSAWRGQAEPFAPLSVGWSRRGEMGTATGLEPAGRRHPLKGRALWCGLYANELLLNLLARDDPAPAVYSAYEQLLASLASSEPQASSLRRFELDLLEGLGVVPDLYHEASTEADIQPERLYHLVPETGLVAVDRPGRNVFPGRSVLVLTGQQPSDPDSASQARAMTRLLLDHQLGGKALKTRELFRHQRLNSNGEVK